MTESAGVENNNFRVLGQSPRRRGSEQRSANGGKTFPFFLYCLALMINDELLKLQKVFTIIF